MNTLYDTKEAAKATKEATKAAKEAAKAVKATEKEAAKTAKVAEKEAVKAVKVAEKDAAKAAKVEEKANKLTPNQLAVNDLFKPDDNGKSEWVNVPDIIASPLNWSSNGNQRHCIFFSDRRYKWEQFPDNGSKVTKLRTIGLSDNELHGASRPIRLDIRKFYTEKGRCCVCGSNSDLVCDHKNDLYNDPRVLSMDTQTLDDFQCLCNHCNLLKSSAEQKARVSGKRYGATNIPQLTIFEVDFVEGDETFDPNDINAFVGTYWYDPVEFMKKVKSRF